ncbi:MAG: hypothetical protein KAV87_54835 [Desulfobacteraceae bacterium]|jgi:hypothetical protein|nr:hypothetical protein [Desulfobacteraceae bacterium]
MSWSEDTMRALRNWLAPDTAYKEHPADDARFYLFIGHVWHDCHSIWDEEIARDTIRREARELHPEWSKELLKKFVENRKSQGTELLDFLTSLREAGKVNELIPV